MIKPLTILKIISVISECIGVVLVTLAIFFFPYAAYVYTSTAFLFISFIIKLAVTIKEHNYWLNVLLKSQFNFHPCVCPICNGDVYFVLNFGPDF